MFGAETAAQIDRVAGSFPTPIADAAAALAAAEGVHERRDRVVEVFRAALRTLAGLALAARAQFGPGPGEPDAQERELLAKLRRSALTDGEWLGLTRALLRPFAAEPALHPLPGLVSLLHGKGALPGRLLDGLLGMRRRETVAHGTTGEADAVAAILAERLPMLADLLARLEPLFAACRLVVPRAAPPAAERQRATLVAGYSPHRGRWKQIELDAGVRLPPGEAAAVNAAGRPLLALDPVLLFRRDEGIEEVYFLDSWQRGVVRYLAVPSAAEHRAEQMPPQLAALFAGEGPAPAATAAQPYRGLDSFDAEHAELFFGREAEIEAVANRVRRHAFVTLTGASGAGKTSLLHAGVVPALARAHAGESPFRDPPASGFESVVVRPGADPVANLARHLAPGTGLEEAVRAAAGRARPLLVVIDQAEEVFTLCADAAARERFAAALAALAADDEGATRVVVAVRGEFFARLAALSPIQALAQRQVFVLRTPSPDALTRTLVEPAARLGYTFDEGLAARMIAAVAGEPAALALLSFTAARLWEARDRVGQRLTVEAHDRLGGVAGALARHADAVVNGLPAGQRGLARDLLLRLVTDEDTRAVVARADLEGAADGAAVAAVLETLATARLITLREDDDGAPRVEIAHEALIGHWTRLRAWRTEADDDRRHLLTVGTAARVWETRGRPRDLLWAGDILAEHRAWRARAGARVTAVEAAFLDAGERLGRDRRRARLAVVAAVGLLLSAAAGVAAFGWRAADRQRLRAESSEQGALAAARVADDARGRAERAAVEAERRRRETATLATEVFNSLAHPPFNQGSRAIDRDTRELLTTALEALARALPDTSVELASHMGQFCVQYQGETPVLAPPDLPAARCELWPVSEEYSLGISPALVGDFKAIAGKAGFESVRVVGYGIERPLVEYPRGGTAADWNRAAQRNNRVEIQLR